MLCWHYCLHCNDWFSRWTLVSCFPLIFIIHISWKRSCGDKWHSFLRTRQDGSCHQQLYQSTTTVLWPFFRDNPGEPVPEENFWTLWCKGILNRGKHTDHLAGRHSIRTNQCPHLPSPHFLQARCPSCHPANSVKALKARHQNCQKNVLVGIKAPKETFCWQFTWKERSGSVWC